MKIAIEGCSHGELDKIYTSIQHIEKQNNFKVDLLLCCGDFQSVRNVEDLESMAIPPKFRKIQDFHQYYSGKKVAPILTVFIGGNHEASNYLAEFPYGGWVCPNIFYMGYANVIQIGGVRIAGLSGIYKGRDYLKGHFEIPPYNEDTKRSVYHIRNVDIFRLKQISEPIDIFMSHDWPRGIYHHGDVNQLLKKKPFFTEDVEKNTLGSRPAEELLAKLQPLYWFSAHLHVKFAALVKHETTSKSTRFLALDKCLPRRQFLQVLDIPSKETESTELSLQYDTEWLSILRSTNHLLSTKNTTQYMPGPGCNERWAFTPTEEELKSTRDMFEGNLEIPRNFERTTDAYDPAAENINRSRVRPQCKPRINPQTTAFCKRLNIDDPISLLINGKQEPEEKLTTSSFLNLSDADVTLEDTDANTTTVSRSSLNPDEISLSDDDDDDDDDDDEEMEMDSEDKAGEQQDNSADEDKSNSSLSPEDLCVVKSTSVGDTISKIDEYELPTSSDADVATPENLSVSECFVVDRKGNLSEMLSSSSTHPSSSPNDAKNDFVLGCNDFSNGNNSAGKRKSLNTPRQMKRRNYSLYAPKDENENDTS